MECAFKKNISSIKIRCTKQGTIAPPRRHLSSMRATNVFVFFYTSGAPAVAHQQGQVAGKVHERVNGKPPSICEDLATVLPLAGSLTSPAWNGTHE